MNNSDDTTELQRQHTHCKLISDKSILIKHEKQNTHWAACNSEITHHECICNEDSMQQKCKSDDDRLIDKELHTESVTTRES